MQGSSETESTNKITKKIARKCCPDGIFIFHGVNLILKFKFSFKNWILNLVKTWKTIVANGENRWWHDEQIRAVRDNTCVFHSTNMDPECIIFDLQLVLEGSSASVVIRVMIKKRSELKERKWSHSEVWAVCLMAPKLQEWDSICLIVLANCDSLSHPAPG